MFCCCVDRGAINSPLATQWAEGSGTVRVVGDFRWVVTLQKQLQQCGWLMATVYPARGKPTWLRKRHLCAIMGTTTKLWENTFACRQTLRFGLVGSVPSVSSPTQEKRLTSQLPWDFQASYWHQAWKKQSWFSLLLPLRWIQASQGKQVLSLLDCLRHVEQGKAFSWNKLYTLSFRKMPQQSVFSCFSPHNKSHF